MPSEHDTPEIEYNPHPKPLNGVQFSQGSLFNLKPDPTHRWPKGYTPQRKQAVEEALSPARTEIQHHKPEENEVYLPGRHFFEYHDPPQYSAAGHPTGKWHQSGDQLKETMKGQVVRAQADIIARSTVPLEDIKSMPAMHVEEIHGAAGTYARPGLRTQRHGMGEMVPDPESAHRGRITVDPSGKRIHQEHTLIHELGHHVDYEADPEAFTRRNLNDRVETEGVTASPRLEGAAEGYAFKHHVARRGEEEPYEKLAAYTSFHDNPHFQQRFQEVSGSTPAEALKKGKVEPPSHIGPQFSNQGRLFARPVDMAETSTEWDYGQWGSVHSPEGKEQDLGTIKVGGGAPAQEERMMPGFRPGDAEHIKNMRSHREHLVPKEHQERVKKAWNVLYPNRKLGDY